MRCGHALMLLSLLSPATSIAADFAISYLFPALAGASLHSSPGLATLALRFQILAGAEGFEPPSSVLETDSLTVELTPLFAVSRQLSAFSPCGSMPPSSDFTES